MSALPRAKILVVDDEAHGRLALQELLEGPDREIVAAASGEAALREVATADFALILLDVRMVGMDGFETARLIHRCERAQRTPIIFLTGAYEDMASVMRGYAAGAVDYVVKPFPPEVVRSKAAVFVDLYYKNAELARQIMERRKAEEALSRANEELEGRIAERTRSLTVANERLRDEVAMRREVEDELRRAKQAAEAASVAKTEFLANMSHEIRTPLNAIVGMTELALQANPTAELHEYLSAVKTSSASLLSIIDDILDLSKIEAGRLTVESIAFSLRECVGDAVRTLALQAREKALELVCDIDASIPDRLVGDPLRLRQILLNLVSNGIKFTDRGEVALNVRCGVQGEAESVSCHFSVRDTGIGIPKDRQGAIFRRFLQADASTSRLYGGSGLGLTIAARLVEMMGGRIWVESAPEQGSVFHFTARFSLARDLDEDSSNRLDALRALVVDDHAESRRIVVEMLRERGARVWESEDADSALETISVSKREGQPIQVVLLDDTLPDTDSYALASRIRQRRYGAPAIVMLGVPRNDAPCRVLMKPVTRAEVLETVRNACGIAAPVKRASAARTVVRHPKLRILLVEDNPLSQKLAYYVLRKEGHEVVTADNGAAALQLYDRQRFDLILMDVRMPRMDGLQATTAIREREKQNGARVPIVALTANAMTGDREACLQAGMDECLIKPIQPADLVAAITRVRVAVPEPIRGVVRRKRVLDRVALLDRLGGDRALLEAMTAIYFRDCERLMRDARAALVAGDGHKLAVPLHTLCGMFGNLSAHAAREAAIELQRLDIQRDPARASLHFDVFESEVRKLDKALAGLVSRPFRPQHGRDAGSVAHAKSST